ncbi:molybdenum cofactor cytidylyltransferase [Thermosyntropha lipolytica DSM 11003]|uniref:Molybdopterin molybdenumtransferase n=1 Tax=Thermosyntropha lipolytica DSM 11003 TaxID=1123382 RepID=A0A1M5LDU9_9FIRM|nr:molybdopterin-binding protein [Thermosyntropha lipolytica]SHG62889.1 molybdenum cofactor cytidylyltransferase [Thermosyntropha lipolytica DSM 11003]
MKKVKVEDAVGMVLAHDLTRIVPGEYKGPAFKKGHVIKEEDIPLLKSMGKNHIYILEMNPNLLHENEAAERIARAAAGPNIILSEPAEGKINFIAARAGLLKINLKLLEKINAIDMVILATLHNHTPVKEGQIVAGTRVIPLVIEKEKIEQVEKYCAIDSPLIWIEELKSLKIGIVVTGTEVYEGRIEDRFGPVLAAKVQNYGSNLLATCYAPDNVEMIKDKIKELIDQGAELIMTSGGMSVDADDVTPTAIREIADEVITYGSPVLPGAMFMLAYKGDIPVLGVPACGMFYRITVLDLVLPRILAGEKLQRADLVKLAHGGMCWGCPTCHYPVCPFGKQG